MIIDKYTKAAWTIIAISLFVFIEIGFKNFHRLHLAPFYAKLLGRFSNLAINCFWDNFHYPLKKQATWCPEFISLSCGMDCSHLFSPIGHRE